MLFMFFILLIIFSYLHIETNAPKTFMTTVICADKTSAVGESTDAGAEMTEEEWNLRVAELNKHQVCLCYIK